MFWDSVRMGMSTARRMVPMIRNMTTTVRGWRSATRRALRRSTSAAMSPARVTKADSRSPVRSAAMSSLRVAMGREATCSISSRRAPPSTRRWRRRSISARSVGWLMAWLPVARASPSVTPERVMAAMTPKNRASSWASTTARSSGARRISTPSQPSTAPRAAMAATRHAAATAATAKTLPWIQRPRPVRNAVSSGGLAPVSSSWLPMVGMTPTISTRPTPTAITMTTAG
ncbi:MAG: hypothetical protein C0475_00195 [Planctomyces sp.]|nr:hypothetical protein [Planctomyces sp.]MBA4119348.1 hypothetical protein [Isosphaera sp.]